MSPSEPALRKSVVSGEPLVWLCGMGLATGLVMIAALLGVIVYKGVDAFWPKRLVRVVLRAEGGAASGEALVGEIARVQEIKAPRSADVIEPLEEWQLHLGNKDVYGQAFRFVPTADIAEVTQPSAFMRIERLEYGPMIAEPVALERKALPPLAASAAPFESALRALVDEVGQRRDEIERIDKKEIGDVNAAMLALRIARRKAELDRDEARVQDADSEMAVLQGEYEALAAEARALRERQGEHMLHVRLAGGEERRLPLGNILTYSYPNQLGLRGRLALFGHRIWEFMSDDPREANTEGGIFPAIFGTFVMTVVLSLVVTPFGVLAAIYLREYAKDGPVVRMVRIAINNLAGVPSIVFGVFGLGFFVYIVGAGFIDETFYPKEIYDEPVYGTGGLLWASLTLALMTVPVVIVASEEALAAVSRGMREGSLGCGASKWQTIQRVVLPAAAPGIITGMILAMARGAGEVAPLMLVGVVKQAVTLPFDSSFPFLHPDRKFMHLGFHIFDLGFQSPDSEAARPMVFATTLLLILLVVVMNFGAILLRERLRRKYSTGAF
jgi:phosphate transport system permease protein